ncbi:MAG: transcriptional repressor [Bacteroidetes bacterium]|nr:transcriptional repressor [Bacteroidota bacterium]MCW5894819.1 transcriptional repressor [Bacteroidota bacterium]
MDTQAAHEILTKHLKSNGKLRATPERFAVLDAVLQSQGHFDVEALYYRLISNGVKVSKATVYNTLELLQECGLVSKYRFAENTSRYEKAFGRPHHHHMICLNCGDIIEFTSDRLERIQEEMAHGKGFEIQSTTIQIFGTCAKCTKKV